MRKWALFCLDSLLKKKKKNSPAFSQSQANRTQTAANHKRAGTLRQSPSAPESHVTCAFQKTAWQRRCLLTEETRREELAPQRDCYFNHTMATDIDRLVSFEEAHYDEYEYYNLEEYSCHAGGKGRSKKEIGLHTNRHSPAGHERKIAEKLQNSELKRRRTKSCSSWAQCLEVRTMRVHVIV